MNFLGHALLSFGNAGILAGNMMGDYVKGRLVLETFPRDVKEGILLHRKIDAYTDMHPATIRARNIFRPAYRLYSGAFVDALFDHFLANDPAYFSGDAALLTFTRDLYRKLDAFTAYYPERFSRMLPYMREQNWLYHYRTLKGLRQAFEGVTRRAKYLSESEQAYQLSVQYYYELNQLYFDFMEDMIQYAKNQLKVPGAC